MTLLGLDFPNAEMPPEVTPPTQELTIRHFVAPDCANASSEGLHCAPSFRNQRVVAYGRVTIFCSHVLSMVDLWVLDGP